MDLQKIKEIYEYQKDYLLRDFKSQKNPLAFILGGQPASGKSNLANTIIDSFPNKSFLFINGDIYREFHPKADELIKHPDKYSAETQILSNFFTENLIKEAIINKINVIIEGTMRNPQIPLNTALDLKKNGFQVEAVAISAPPLFTELGFYIRYQEEIDLRKCGRLSEVESHELAVKGIPISLDVLYKEKAVDKIHLYTYQGKNHIITYSLMENQWDIKTLPSIYIAETRKQQFEDKKKLEILINKGNSFFERMQSFIKPNVDKILTLLEQQLESLNQERKRGFRR